MHSYRILRASPITIDDKELFANLIVLDMDDYKIILGMDWLLSIVPRLNA